jgi:hypothetical protein
LVLRELTGQFLLAQQVALIFLAVDERVFVIVDAIGAKLLFKLEDFNFFFL